MLPFLNQKNEYTTNNNRFFYFFKQVNISKPLLNNTIELMRKVLYLNKDLKKLGLFFLDGK